MRPRVLLHGFAQPPTAWGDLVAQLDAAALALPGHAADAPLGATWDETIDALAARLPAHALVIGYSLGARLALGLLAADRIDGAILISVHPGLASATDRAARRAADAAWIEALRTRPWPEVLDAWEAQPIFATAARAPRERRAARRRARAQLEPTGLAAAMAVLGLGAMPDLADALVARAGRARLIVGADDGKFRQLATALAARAPTLGPTIVDGSGHDPTLEQPTRLAAEIGALAHQLDATAASMR
ncbi:MAG: alpha/beta fold hydrolase [Kofleriaceae bacterium]